MSDTKIHNQVKIGVMLSYVLIILNTVYGLFITPYMIGQLGTSEYGVYKTISSLSSSLMVLDLGIGSTVMRFVAKYRATKDEKSIPNFVAMSLIQAAALSCIILAIGAVIFFSIKPVYSTTFSSAELQKAQILFCILLLNMVLHVFENVINGVITGSNRFQFGNGIKVIRLLMRVFLIIGLLAVCSSSIVLVLIDLMMTMASIIVEMVYIVRRLHIKPKYSHWDRALFFESGKYTILMFLTSIAAQVNNNLDNVIIGAISGPALVTVYSMGLLIFGMYENLSTSVSGVVLPTVTNLLEEDKSGEKLQKFIVKVGRIQFLLLGAAVVGFACVGKDFINAWLGAGYEDVYVITLILMVPSLFELCVNVCLSILRARNKLVFRTCILFASTILNAIVTVLAVKYWSYIGAAFGTAASFIIGSLIVMNLYYYKELHLPMLKIYRGITKGIWLCLAIAGVALFLVSRRISGGWGALIVNIIIFCIIYGAMLIAFGLSTEEINSIPFIKKTKRVEKEK